MQLARGPGDEFVEHHVLCRVCREDHRESVQTKDAVSAILGEAIHDLSCYFRGREVLAAHREVREHQVCHSLHDLLRVRGRVRRVGAHRGNHQHGIVRCLPGNLSGQQ